MTVRAIAELQRSIEQFGVLTPITVRSAPDGTGDYLLIKGQGRTLACRLLGIETIPAFVVDDRYTDDEKVQQFLVENVARLKMRPVDRALLIARARQKGEETADIARRFGVSPATVRRLEGQLDGASNSEVAALRSGRVNLAVHAVISRHVVPAERPDVVSTVARYPVRAKEIEALFVALGWRRLAALGDEYRQHRLILLGWACTQLAELPQGPTKERLCQLALRLPRAFRVRRRPVAGNPMKLMMIHPDELQLSSELSRSGSAKQFEERLKSSIEEIGIAEPIKVAPLPEGGYVVIDGMMRLRAVNAIREKQPDRFQAVAVYVFDYERRFEIRYQSDIYQDLLPSQLAMLVEHLHRAEHVRKVDIARYIGVSPATLRNYTGLWRLLQRGGLFAKIVDLMDVEVIPSSNPYAWLRLTSAGLRKVIEDNFSEGEPAETWIEHMVKRARQGDKQRFPITLVETITNVLAPEYYRVGEEVRSVKRDLGQRKGGATPAPKPPADSADGLNDLGQRDTGQQKGAAKPARRTPADIDGASEHLSQPDLLQPEGRAAPAPKAPVGIGDASGHFGQLDLLQPEDGAAPAPKAPAGVGNAVKHLGKVSRGSRDPILRTAAKSLQEYLQ